MRSVGETGHRISAEGCKPDVILLSIVMRGTRRIMYLENNHWQLIPAFVPSASGGEPTEQWAGRKKIRLSERSELPDFPACKRREGVWSARSLDLLVTFGSSQKWQKKEIHRFALNDKRPNTEEHPPAPLQRGEERSEGGCYPFGRGKSGAQRWGKRHRISAEGCKPDVTIVIHLHIHY